jgi:hypothetical protein
VDLCLQGDYGRAADTLAQVPTLARSVGDTALMSSALHHLAGVRGDQGDAAGALAVTEESLELARELGVPEAVGDALAATVWALARAGDVRRARAPLGESLALLQRPDAYLDATGVNNRLFYLGFAARSWGGYEEARAVGAGGRRQP